MNSINAKETGFRFSKHLENVPYDHFINWVSSPSYSSRTVRRFEPVLLSIVRPTGTSDSILCGTSSSTDHESLSYFPSVSGRDNFLLSPNWRKGGFTGSQPLKTRELTVPLLSFQCYASGECCSGRCHIYMHQCVT